MRNKETTVDALSRQAVLSVCGTQKQVEECQTETGMKGRLSQAVIDRVREQVQHVQIGKPIRGRKESPDRIQGGTVRLNSVVSSVRSFPEHHRRDSPHNPTRRCQVPLARDHESEGHETR